MYTRYIKEIDSFYSSHQKNLSAAQISMWHTIAKLYWLNDKNEEWIEMKTKTLMELSGLSKKSIYNVREQLREINLIDYQKSGTRPLRYKIISNEANQTPVNSRVDFTEAKHTPVNSSIDSKIFSALSIS